jgi:hypothetical protein
LLGLLVVVMAGFGVAASFRFAYESLFGDLKDRVEVAKVLFPVLLALIGGPLLVWRVITAHWGAQAARQQAETAREAHYTDLFSKAIEQLGATREVKSNVQTLDVTGGGGYKREASTTTEANLEMRLGAIYALERIARDSERDRRPILNVLCAYVRSFQNTGAPALLQTEWWKSANGLENWVQSVPPLRSDVQAAVELLGRAVEVTGDEKILSKARLDLSHGNLQRADLRELCFHFSWMTGVNFALAILLETNFEFVELSYSYFREANMEGARLRGAALFGSDLTSARNLEFHQIAEALGDGGTKLPNKMSRPEHWPDRRVSWAERRNWYLSVRRGHASPTESMQSVS